MTEESTDFWDELRAWARLDWQRSTAVEFLARTQGGTHWFPGLARDPNSGAGWYINFDQMRIIALADPTISSGQRATLLLAASIAGGELAEHFWRLDTNRKAAFVRALLDVVDAEAHGWADLVLGADDVYSDDEARG